MLIVDTLAATIKIAVEGCSHGCLNDIYATVQKAEQEKGTKVDLLLLCGDFQVSPFLPSFSTLLRPMLILDLTLPSNPSLWFFALCHVPLYRLYVTPATMIRSPLARNTGLWVPSTNTTLANGSLLA